MAKTEFSSFLEQLQALAKLKSGFTGRVLYVYGDNAYLKQKALCSIKAKRRAINPDTVIDLDWKKQTEHTLYEAFTQNDLFSEKLLYICELKDSDDALQRTLAMMTDLSQSNHQFVFVSQSKRLSEKLKKELTRLGATLLHAANPAPFEFSSYIGHACKLTGLNLTNDASTALLDFCGNDLMRIDNELATLTLIFINHGERAISRNELVEHLGFLREDEGFKLKQLILDGKRAQALCLAVDLLRRGDSALALLGLLTKHIRQSLIVCEGLAKSRTPQEILSATGLHPSGLKRYNEYSKRLGANRLKVALKQCVRADQRLKTNRMSEDLALTEILTSLV